MVKFRTLAAACALSVLTAVGALAQTGTATNQPAGGYNPTVGQAGKDVVWVPTPQVLIDRMLQMARVTKDDFVIDLGSGDGRTVITAARLGARAHGLEYNPDLVALSQRSAEAAGVTGRATFEQADIFESDFSKATVVTMFLLPDLNLKLRPILLDMKPGTRVVSNTFDMGDWEPDDRVQAGDSCTSYCNAHMWIIPAKVAGTWRLGDGQLTLNQTYQMLSGRLTQGGRSVDIADAKMNGRTITFMAGKSRYTGEVNDDGTITGRTDAGASWTAARARN